MYEIEDFKIEKSTKIKLGRRKKIIIFIHKMGVTILIFSIEFSKNYNVPENPYGMLAEEYYWYLEDHDLD